ncbi:MAG: guanylate kinase [Endomicrobia bacterium]|nr:guanylate kinase [Endomicrobiia bacterium]
MVISAPSGTGKTTVCKKLLEQNPHIVFSVSYTTRQKRSSEVEGKDYYFVSEDKFKKLIKQKKFVEWAKVHNHYYGTPKQPLMNTITSGKDILLDIDVQGGKSLKKIFPSGIFIFLLPPSWKDLKQRIIRRGQDNIKEIKLRLNNVMKELKYIKYYDYIVINDKLEETVKIINSIIYSNRYKIKLI